MWSTAAILVPVVAAHALFPGTHVGEREDERGAPLPGDDIVPHPKTGYTMAITIRAAPSDIWPWLVQMGQGRGGFYTHEWVENLLSADIHNADRSFQRGSGWRWATRSALRPTRILDSPVNS